MRSKLSDLKSLYTTLGGESTDVLNANSEIAVLNGILALGNVDSSKFIPDAIKAIADNLNSIDPSPAVTLDIANVTPTTSAQTISPESGHAYKKVEVAAVTAAIDSNITAGNIKNGVSILGVEGSMTCGAEFSAWPTEFTLSTNISNLNAVIPNGITSIGIGAFYNCAGLTSVEIPSSVTSIGNNAFNGCIGLTDVIISNGVTSIGTATFYGCTSLTSIDIPSSVTSIGNTAFSGCTDLTTITVHKAEGSITGAPWGAPETTQVIWDG